MRRLEQQCALYSFSAYQRPKTNNVVGYQVMDRRIRTLEIQAQAWMLRFSSRQIALLPYQRRLLTDLIKKEKIPYDASTDDIDISSLTLPQLKKLEEFFDNAYLIPHVPHSVQLQLPTLQHQRQQPRNVFDRPLQNEASVLKERYKSLKELGILNSDDDDDEDEHCDKD